MRKYEKVRNDICIEDMEVDSKPNDNINDALLRCIDSSGMSIAQFSKKTGITQASISRYRKKTAVPTLETIVTTCIALRINIFQSLYLISIAGYNVLCSDDKKVYLLLIILSRYSELDLGEANDILIGLNSKPLKKIKQNSKVEGENDYGQSSSCNGNHH